MPEEKRINALAVLLKNRGGFVSIREAVKLLGPEEYSRCLVDLTGRGEDDEEYADLYFQNSDCDTGTPTHVCFSSAFMDLFCDILDDALEKHGILIPRIRKGDRIV